MPIDSTTLRQLQRLSTSATAEVLQAYYPQVLRIARGLSGRADACDKIVRFIMKRAAKAASHWHHEDAPQRWFLHHTVLAARRFSRKDPKIDRDELLLRSGSSDAAYTAFIRALRQLPHQQREAFLLHHAENLNDRLMSVAMDLSISATSTHLKAAADALAPLAGDRLNDFLALLKRAYHDDISEETSGNLLVDWVVTRYVVPRRIWRFLIWLFMLAIIVFVALAVWEFRGKIEW